jgi:hypothetical protein
MAGFQDDQGRPGSGVCPSSEPPERAILDTSVIIAADIAPLPGVLAISAITLAELQFGVKHRPLRRAGRTRGDHRHLTSHLQVVHLVSWRHTLITVQEIRHIHHLALTLVWQVSPHPDASDAEAPGNFRRHDWP